MQYPHMHQSMLHHEENIWLTLFQLQGAQVPEGWVGLLGHKTEPTLPGVPPVPARFPNQSLAKPYVVMEYPIWHPWRVALPRNPTSG